MPSAVKAGSRYMAAKPRSPSARAASSMWPAYRCTHPSSPRLYEPWVAVPDHGDVVVAVEVRPGVRVEQPDALATDEVQRAGVEQRRSGQRPTAALEQATGGRPSVREPTAGLAETPRDSVN